MYYLHHFERKRVILIYKTRTLKIVNGSSLGTRPQSINNAASPRKSRAFDVGRGGSGGGGRVEAVATPTIERETTGNAFKIFRCPS